MKKTIVSVVAHVLTLCLTVSATTVFAQQAKATETTLKYTIPADKCVKPTVPEKRATAAQQKQFTADMDSYRSCLADYTGEMRRVAEEHNRAAAAYITAANKVIEEYNAYIKSVSESTEEKKKP